MTILTISNCPLVESQGSGYVILNFARGLVSKGHQVDLVGPEDCESFKFLRRGRRIRIAIGILWVACARILKKHYDVVEFYGGESWLAATVLSLIFWRTFVLISHSNGIETHADHVMSQANQGSGRQRVMMALQSLAFTRVDGIVTVSEYDRDYALKHEYQPKSRIVAIENALPDEFLGQPLDDRKSQTIGYCGSWISRKNTAVVISDVSRILHEFPESRLKLIGIGEEFSREKTFAPELHDRIEIIPFVSKKSDLRKIYQTVSVLVMPSIYESFGLVAAEGMASGCAVVANRTGFPASLVNDEEVVLMEGPGPGSLYAAVKKLLNDDLLRIKVARKGYERVQKLTWESANSTLENTYLRWLNERSNPASATLFRHPQEKKAE